MSQKIQVGHDEELQFEIKCTGLILCNYTLIISEGDEDIWQIEGDNDNSKDREKYDNDKEAYIYPIGNILNNYLGTVIVWWTLDLESTQSSGESYDASIAIVTDNGTWELVRFRSADDGYGPLKNARSGNGSAMLKVL